MATLNEVFSTLVAQRRYEVWFLRLGLADGSGAFWLRYLLMNPGRGGCPGSAPVQVWATWFLASGKPQTLIQGFPVYEIDLSAKGLTPFHFRTHENEIGEDFCRGTLKVDGHTVSWNLRYRSTFHVTLSNKGWIGFSRTPHSDAVFSGDITLDGLHFVGDPLGFGVQGHNCGYRHRNFWTWGHAYFPRIDRPASTLEALVYEMPFGLIFRRAVLWHEGESYRFSSLKGTADRKNMRWSFRGAAREGLQVEASFDGSGPSVHRLLYMKTDCSGCFEVTNNSLASASLLLEAGRGRSEKLETNKGAVLEMAG
ncbi:MAG: hypothetical protein ACLQLC_19635 [Candidatus Sulfotelmatobacter sp.]